MRRSRVDVVVEKYLRRYAEPEGAIATSEQFSNAIAIPAMGEGESLHRAIASVPGCGSTPTLLVVVINHRIDASPHIKAANRDAAHRLAQTYPVLIQRVDARGEVSLHSAAFGQLLLIQCVLPLGQGVGLARKIAHDYLLRVWQRGQLKSRFLYATDADVILPSDYFGDQRDDAVGLISPFRHRACEPQLREALERYDSWLRYRVLGLAFATSPYAHHTIGSTIAIAASAYAQVRGFPRRQAGEDFYLLDKLRKIGVIATACHEPIVIAGRISDRAPFGTGRAMRDAGSMDQQSWSWFDSISSYQKLGCAIRFGREVLRGVQEVEEADIAERARRLEPAVHQACKLLGVPAALARIARSSSGSEQRERAWDCWFDSFRTLQFLNKLRANPDNLLRFEQIGPDLERMVEGIPSSCEDDWRQLRQRVAAFALTRSG